MKRPRAAPRLRRPPGSWTHHLSGAADDFSVLFCTLPSAFMSESCRHWGGADQCSGPQRPPEWTCSFLPRPPWKHLTAMEQRWMKTENPRHRFKLLVGSCQTWRLFINRGSQVNPTLLETSVINKENCMYVHSLCLWSGDKLKEKPWMGDLCSERVFCWQGVLSDGLCPHWWSISTLMERSPSTGREGSLTGVMKMMWIICLGLRRPRATHSDSEQGVCQKSSRWIIKGVTGCCVISAWCGRLFSCTDKERRGRSGNWAESLYLALCGQWWLLLF